jgi:hypothetical protein
MNQGKKIEVHMTINDIVKREMMLEDAIPTLENILEDFQSIFLMYSHHIFLEPGNKWTLRPIIWCNSGENCSTFMRVGMQCIFKHHFPFYNIIYSHMVKFQIDGVCICKDIYLKVGFP